MSDEIRAVNITRMQKSFSARIPAAIAKAEKHVEHSDVDIESGHIEGGKYFATERSALTATEVALAKALWDYCKTTHRYGYQDADWIPTEALRAFTEKVESLD